MGGLPYNLTWDLQQTHKIHNLNGSEVITLVEDYYGIFRQGDDLFLPRKYPIQGPIFSNIHGKHFRMNFESSEGRWLQSSRKFAWIH